MSEGLAETLLFLAAGACALFGFGLPDLGERGWGAAPRVPGTLRVVTWNVGGTGEGSGRGLADESVPAVAQTLAALDFDLCFLQEVGGRDQLLRIVDAVGGEVSLAREGSLAALARRGRLRTRHAEHVAGRPLLLVEYEADTGQRVLAAGVHADPWSARERNASIGAAVERLHETRGPAARLLAGDLNLDLDRRARQDLFTDDENLDVETYGYGTERLLDVGLGTGPTAEPDRRLDYVWIDPGGLAAASRDAVGPWRGRRVGDMDHHPLVCDLRFVR